MSKLKWLLNCGSEKVAEFQKGCRWKTIIGDPKATEKYSVKALSEMGLVGIYRDEINDN